MPSGRPFQDWSQAVAASDGAVSFVLSVPSSRSRHLSSASAVHRGVIEDAMEKILRLDESFPRLRQPRLFSAARVRLSWTSALPVAAVRSLWSE